MKTRAKGHKRTIRYIDPVLQRKVLIGLIAFELLLLGGGLVYLYIAFNEIIELRRHSSLPAGISDISLLTKELLITAAVICMINIPIIILVVSIWADNLRNILRPYSRAMSNLANLDFRKARFSNTNHPLVTAIHKLFHVGRIRQLRIREHIRSLEHAFSNTEKSDDEKPLRKQVDELLSIVGKK